MIDLNRILHFWQIIAAQPCCAWLPAWTFPDRREFIFPTFDFPELFTNVLEMTKLKTKRQRQQDVRLFCAAKQINLCFDWIECIDGMDETIGDLFIVTFSSKRPKQAIPNDENTGIVLIDTVRISSVMYSMVAGRVEYILEWAELRYHVGVNPKLVQKIHLSMNHKYLRRNEEGQRQIEYPREIRL
jgi:hypothetical protein